MQTFSQLFTLVGPLDADRSSGAESSKARQLLLAALSVFAAISCGSVWGIAAGSHDGHIAFDNAIKVPMLLVVSSLAALPAALLVFHLTARRGHATHLVLGYSAAIFSSTLVLALLAPIVLLFQFSSTWAGPIVAMGSVGVGLLVGGAILVRVLGKMLPESNDRRAILLPVGFLVLLQGAAILQLASITTPIFPSRTLLGHGIDGIAHVEGGQ